MAITFQVVYTFLDDSGQTATGAIDVPTTFSLAQYTEFVRGMAAFIDDVVSGVVLRAELAANISMATLTGNTAAVGSDVEEINFYQFQTAAGRRVSIAIPGTDETDVSPNSDDLNQVDTQQAAFINAMLSGVAVTAGTIIPCDIDSEDLTTLVTAREAFRASGKRR